MKSVSFSHSSIVIEGFGTVSFLKNTKKTTKNTQKTIFSIYNQQFFACF